MLVTSGCLLSRKVWWAVWIGSFGSKIEVFYRSEWINRWTRWKWVLSIFSFSNEYYKQIGKSSWKNEIICLVPCSLPELRSLNCLKTAFLQFCADLSEKSELIKAIIYMHRKALVTHFQKLMLFIMLWLTASMVWMFEVE